MMRKFLPMVVALLTVVTSCTTIPNAGPVISADIDTGVTEVDFDFLPPGPSAGATQEEILAGFIAAGTAAQNNYRVARSYLVSTAAEVWNPNASVLIRSGEAQISLASTTLARYAVPVAASVDSLGRYSESPTPSAQTLEFRFLKEGDEWRISTLPDGIVLTEPAFAEAFASYRLYYFSAGYRELVADERWFATRAEVSGKIVRALLEAPSFWLDQGATVSAFPEGTQLALSPIVVTDGVASVDLTSPVLSANEVTRQRMLLQLTTSLAQVQGISSARISVNQNELVIPILGDEGPSLASGRDPRVVVLRDRRFGHLQGGQIEVIEGLSENVANLLPQRIFYSAESDQAVITRADGAWRVAVGQEPELVDPRPDLVRPIIDSCGYIWSSSSQAGPEMTRIISSTGDFAILPMELGEEATLVSFELARDDTRLLLLVQTETGVRLLLAAVTRDLECQPIGLGEFVELGPLPGDGVDAAWIDDSTVAVVLQDEMTRIGEAFVIDVSGRSSSLGRPARPATLVGGVGGIAGLRLLSQDGALYQPRGNGWQATGDRAGVIATQR
jgi:hypothetical protein